MKRMIAFCLMLCAVAGFLLGAHTVADGLKDDVVITARHLCGDPARVEGVALQTLTTYGSYVWWDTSCIAGQTPVTDSRFHFSQKGLRLWEREERWREFSLGTSGGMGMSTSDSDGFSFGDWGLGPVVNAVAERTASGETREETLLLEDYMDYYPLDYWVEIETSQVMVQGVYGVLDEENRYELDKDEACYQRWTELFRFPVVSGDTVTISVSKGLNGAIMDVNVSLGSPDTPQKANVSFAYVVVEEGMFFYPLFQDTQGQPIGTGQYIYGNGLYYIPFRPLEGVSGTIQPSTFDFEALEMVCPLDSGSQLVELVESADGTCLHLLSQEENGYCYRLFDLSQKCATQSVSIPLTDAMRSFYPEQELLYLRSDEAQALVRTGAQASLEFVTTWPREESWMNMPKVVQYRDGVLYGAVESWYETNQGVLLMVCDETGLTYAGLYSSNLNGTAGYDSSWINLESMALKLP